MSDLSTLPMTEAQYQQRILDYALLTGWRVHHCRPLRRQDGRYQTPVTGHVGWPDLVLVRQGRVLVLEVKAAGRQPTPEQRDWLEEWMTVSCAEVLVVWPATWPRVVELLT